jgi:hypothetical protein
MFCRSYCRGERGYCRGRGEGGLIEGEGRVDKEKWGRLIDLTDYNTNVLLRYKGEGGLMEEGGLNKRLPQEWSIQKLEGRGRGLERWFTTGGSNRGFAIF